LLKNTKLPEKIDAPAARAEFKALAHQCNRVANLCEDLHAWPETIEFAIKQMEFANLAAGATTPSQDVDQLLIWGRQTLMVAYMATGKLDEAQQSWKDLVRAVAWGGRGGIEEQACRQIGEYAVKLTAAARPVDPASFLAPDIADREKKLASDPSNLDRRLELRRGLRALGLTLEYAQRYDDAVRIFDKLLALGKLPMDKTDQTIGDFYRFSLLGRATCLEGAKRDAEADAAWRSFAVEGGESLLGWWRISKLAELGRHAKAARLIETGSLNILSGSECYEAACIFAVASKDPAVPSDRKDAYAGKAMTFLKRAREAGYFEAPKTVGQLKTDVSLDPLRGRDDFKKFLDAMTTP
jgi:tetratricopeptide (TPR) repeat protein